MAVRSRKGLAAGVLALLLLAIAGLRGRLRRFAIAENSMVPALNAGDYVLAVGVDGRVKRGDIVIFSDPSRADFDLVKRVIGLPGEAISILNGQVHVDGSVLAEPWADGPTYPEGAWQLASDDVFVLGDARAASRSDSRKTGPVALDAIGWKVAVRYWPPASAGRV